MVQKSEPSFCTDSTHHSAVYAPDQLQISDYR